MIVWGGVNQSERLQDGGRFNPATNTWTALPTSEVVAGRAGAAAVWSGSEMMVWGGNGLADGASFNPATNVWTPLVAASGPGGRSGLSAVWTGMEMIVWGGVRRTPGNLV